ncbi:SusC/RagA family TonB-linked outer membrane protein [Peijinzhouia sedimentorum]
MRKIFLLFLIMLSTQKGWAQEQLYPISGTVTDENGLPLVGAYIYDEDRKLGSISDEAGWFSMEGPAGDYLLQVSFVGYEQLEKAVSVPLDKPLALILKSSTTDLAGVTILSSGYQDVPRERVTGSYSFVNEELINRRVSTNLLDRLEDVTSGLILHRSEAGFIDPVSIRGRSTLLGNAEPLIIVDNFPYDGGLENINPNDVESITILKDAAAASIWGTRAGNGVIVINTKKGSFNQDIKVRFNSNINVTSKPDLHYVPQMKIGDYVDLERELFLEGAFAGDVNAQDNRGLSPIAELLIAHENGQISESELEASMTALKSQDLRQDMEDYLYRERVDQQYSLSLSGGSNRHQFNFGLGYDHNLASIVGNTSERITLNTGQSMRFFKDRLRWNTSIYYTERLQNTPNEALTNLQLSQGRNLPPYMALADAQGNPIRVTRDYRRSLLDQAQADGLLNWDYFPLSDYQFIEKTNQTRDYRINTGFSVDILPGLTGELQYQYWRANISNRDLYGEQSFYARDLVNQYSQVDGDGNISRAIPVGGILDRSDRSSYSHNGRGQLRYQQAFGNEKHQINALAGYEVKVLNSGGSSARYYGYNDRIAASLPVDFTGRFPLYHRNTESSIPLRQGHSELSDRFISYYGNLAYNFEKRYDVTLSARKDQSNLFGVNSNQRGVPLWSAGAGWTLSEEGFYSSQLIPYLKLRATYGFNGNIDKSLTAFTTARRVGVSSVSQLPYAEIQNPPNPNLVWERVEMMNIGLDFDGFNDRVNGSFEFYTKNGLDLIGLIIPLPSTGLLRYRGNTSDLKSQGIDVILNSVNLDKVVRWESQFLFSSQWDKVGFYDENPSSIQLLQNSHRAIYPLTGYPLFGLFSIPWAGLDGQTGDPQFIREGEVSTDYTDIYVNSEHEDLRFHGSAKPRSFGSLRNTFSYQGFTLSMNISFRLNYYFRRASVRYAATRGLGTHGDYYSRWQAPGDELITDIPSVSLTNNFLRDELYTYSSSLVEPGDHIRLQDIQVSYLFDQSRIKHLPFKRAELYAYINNVGLIWKKTDIDIDPDFLTNRPLRSIAMGLKIDF